MSPFTLHIMGFGPLGKYAAKVRKTLDLHSVANFVGFVDLLLLCYSCMWDPHRVLQVLEVLANNHAELVVRLPAALLQAGHRPRCPCDFVLDCWRLSIEVPSESVCADAICC